MKAAWLSCLLAIFPIGAVSGVEELMALPEREFVVKPALLARINTESLDQDLLSAAIFHETNRVRRQFNLSGLMFLTKLNAAADVEASVGSVSHPPSHTNPFMLIATPMDRVKNAGLVPRFVAENIAMISVYEIDSDLGVGIIKKKGKLVFVNPDTLEELRLNTYAGFARSVVKTWMASPGHRLNMLRRDVTHLGCALRPTKTESGVEMIFAVQVFFQPRDRQHPDRGSTTQEFPHPISDLRKGR